MTPHAGRPIKANIDLARRLPDTFQIMQQPHLAVHMRGYGVRQGVGVLEYDALQHGVRIDELQVVRVENRFGNDAPLGDGSRDGDGV